ncbi:MAG TPA: PKD domain-containing protein, partial [Bacteroidetes bacterium]|nr:PKD domain-containing protein [Bacteroidota bacterium]
LSVCAAPGAAFSFSAGTNPQMINFIDNSTGSPTSWLWDFGDGQTSVQQNPNNLYASTGTYTVCLTATDSCGSDTLCLSVMVGVSGVNGGLPDLEVNLWPNPAGEQVMVEVNLPARLDLEVRLRDVAGRSLVELHQDAATGLWQQPLDLSAVAAGMYFLEVRAGDFVITKKLLVE